LSSLADRISQLRQRASEVAAEIASLLDKRRSYSFAAATGDEHARKQIADLDFQSDSLRKEEQTALCGIEAAEALLKQHQLDAEAKLHRERQVEAHEHATAIAAINLELDQMLLQVRECLERRAIHLRSLGNTATVDPNLLMRLSNKSGPTSACHHAGLGRYINLEMTPVVSQRPLADSNSLLLGIGEAPAKSNGKANGRGKAS
jgi:hypothetical protein